jgi:PBP1b-binding outer membrane lipoprotein LpoB
MRNKVLLPFFIVLLISGCSKPPSSLEFSWELFKDPTVNADTFKGKKIAIMPSSRIEFDPTQEIYREALGGLIYMSFNKYSIETTLLPVDATQSAVNRAALWNEVQEMYKEYEVMAVLRKDTLAKVGKTLDAQYVIMPKILRFVQESFDRASILGLSILRTRQSTVDVQIQIWDTATGEVVWQGVGEGSEAAEVVEGRPVSFLTVTQFACESLFYRLPWLPEEMKKKGK